MQLTLNSNLYKVQILWEGHKIWKNFPPFFKNNLVTSKQSGRFFFKCGLLRISELYQSMIMIYNFTCHNIKPNILYIKKTLSYFKYTTLPLFFNSLDYLLSIILTYSETSPGWLVLKAPWYFNLPKKSVLNLLLSKSQETMQKSSA